MVLKKKRKGGQRSEGTLFSQSLNTGSSTDWNSLAPVGREQKIPLPFTCLSSQCASPSPPLYPKTRFSSRLKRGRCEKLVLLPLKEGLAISLYLALSLSLSPPLLFFPFPLLPLLSLSSSRACSV